ncbi:MAG TPA: NAD(P)-dependent alcohol dehydrogenase [Friedmanniella sp.]
MNNASAVLHGPHDVRIEDRTPPRPLVGQVLVEIAATGICGSDVHYYEHGRIGDHVVREPMVIGHESAGIVVEVGEGVDRSRVGELVALEPGVPCRRCEQCLRGRYNLCPRVVFFATPPVDGSITGYVAIDAAFAHPAPPGLTAEQAAMAEPVSVGVWAARKCGVGGGDRVLVTGAGPIGLLAAQVARALGAEVPLITDVSDFRLDRARRLGLRTSRADAALEEEFDVLLECSGAPSALSTGLAALAPAGRAALVGMGADTVALNVPLVQSRELTITGVFRYANTYPFALALISSGAVDVDGVITHRFSVGDTEQALTIGRRDPQSLKAIVTTPGAGSLASGTR